MKTITADTLTLDEVAELAGVASNAASLLSLLRTRIETGEIHPAAAAAEIHDMLRPLQIEPLPVRYFMNGNMVWRYFDGSVDLRTVGGNRWLRSETFHSIDDLAACVDVTEVPESKLPNPIPA